MQPQIKSSSFGEYAKNLETTFERYIWTKIVRSSRDRYDFFAEDSPLRILAGDLTMWMSRIYRIALDRYETFPKCEGSEIHSAVQKARAEMHKHIPERFLDDTLIEPPLKGGECWDIHDPRETEEVINEAIGGNTVLESLDPVLEVINSSRVHEDFSERYSWIKEDFERTFYSKRAKLKVSLVETLDDFPAWSAGEPCGYENILFRDILSFFNRKEQHLILALRQGKTQSEIAKEYGHNGHAAISRKVKDIKRRIRRLLE